MSTNNAREIVKSFLGHGIYCVPVLPGKKGSFQQGWQTKRIGIDQVDKEFNAGSNILRLNGEASGWQVDVDCDTSETIIAANLLLPPTDWVHGHSNSPMSHFTYLCSNIKSAKFQDPTIVANPEIKKQDVARKARKLALINMDDDEFEAHEEIEEPPSKPQLRASLVEIRSDKTGTIMPGSVHTSGAQVVFYKNGQPNGYEPPSCEPTTIVPEELQRIVGKIAAATLMARYWPDGARNECTMHLSGMLLHGGMLPQDTIEFVDVVCKVAQDEERSSRKVTASATAERFAKGEPVTGFPNLIDVIDKRVAEKVCEWLGLKSLFHHKTGKPILAVNQDFDIVMEDATNGLLKANEVEPKFFQFGGKLATVELKPIPHVRVLTVNNFREALAEQMAVMEMKQDSKGNDTSKDVVPPLHLLTSLAESPRISRFPEMIRISPVPIVSPAGTLQTEFGYHAASKTFMYSKELEALTDAREVKMIDVKRSLDFFDTGPLSGFMFAEAASRTHAYCAMLQHIVRDLIQGCTPLYLVQAPTRSSGKTLLARFLARVSAPDLYETKFPNNEEEREKLIMSLLMAGATHILLDNVRNKVDSSSLDQALTSDNYKGRILGQTGIGSVPNRATWMMTANNADFGPDLPSRTVLINLDTGEERPEDRRDFKIPDLDAWAVDNRFPCIQHALTLVRFWIQEGMPVYSGSRSHRASSWMRIMGGLCETIGLTDFLGNTEDLADASDSDHQQACCFVEGWYKGAQERPFGAKGLVGYAYGIEDDGDEFPAPLWSEQIDRMSDSGKVQKLGHWLKKNKNRVCNGLRIQVISGQHSNEYKLEVTPQRSVYLAKQRENLKLA
ncbi:MAG: hypothetical protein ACRYFS_22015 [Janthinobacterium lividum]